MRHYPREDHLKLKFNFRPFVGLNTPVSHHFPGYLLLLSGGTGEESPLSKGGSETASALEGEV